MDLLLNSIFHFHHITYDDKLLMMVLLFINRGDVKQETTNLELLMADSGQVELQ